MLEESKVSFTLYTEITPYIEDGENTKKSIILLFVQQKEPPHSRSINSHVNQRKKKKEKLSTTAITIKTSLKYLYV